MSDTGTGWTGQVPPTSRGPGAAHTASGFSFLVPTRYIQVPAEFIARLSAKERLDLAYYLYLKARFQSGFIHASLDADTRAKAEMGSRQLRKVLRRLQKASFGAVAVRIQDVKRWRSEHPFERMAAEIGDGWALADKGTFARRVRDAVPNKLSRARCTVTINMDMDARAIRNELNKKVFEHQGAQMLCERQRRRDKGGELVVGEQASNGLVGEYPTHSSVTKLGSVTKHQAQLPGKAYARKMGLSPRTFWRSVALWEKRGDIKRIRRRVKLDAIDDPKEFHRLWGIMPFRVGGLWYGQAPNLYEFIQDYRGPYSELRREKKGYGKSVTQMLAAVRK